VVTGVGFQYVTYDYSGFFFPERLHCNSVLVSVCI